MTQYISKSALVAEIEKYKKEASERLTTSIERPMRRQIKDKAWVSLCQNLLSFIGSLGVKEVDLEKELIQWHKNHFERNGTFIGMNGFYLENASQIDIARHFFELGLKVAQKG